jgi:RHS repeat-associated protein
VREERRYDKAGWLVMIAEKNGKGELLRAEGYVYDDVGRRSRSVNEEGKVTAYEYDVQSRIKAVLYEGEMNNGMGLGYTGKPYDPVTGLYNYGYRDYAPEVARFTSEDPVRDGANWFAYVNNDPVNWVDLWGLSANDTKTYSYLTFSMANETNRNTMSSEIGQFIEYISSPFGERTSNFIGDLFETITSILTENQSFGQTDTKVSFDLGSLIDLVNNEPISIHIGVNSIGGQTSIDMQFPIIGFSLPVK